MSYKYIMVTGFANHWTKINETQFPYRLLKGDTTGDDKFIENTPTTFVKLPSQEDQTSGVWSGHVFDIREDAGRVRFRVRIDSVENNFESYANLEKGWYIERITEPSTPEKVTSQVSDLQPPFFANLIQTSNWADFEDYTYYLLRLLGIHNVHKIERAKQRGKADGFFKFKGLAVIYDCTLEQETRDENKAQQISNYCGQLESGSMTFDGNIAETFYDLEKQVWIITRDKSRVVKKKNDITVKEVSILQLIDIYEYRLRQKFSEADLVKQLQSIGQIIEL